MNVVGGNPGGRARYFLNDETTIKKLKAAADKIGMKVNHNTGSKTIEFSTGAYVSVVLPLIKLWQDIKGHPIHPEEVDGLDITVLTIEIERDLGGTILNYKVELKVQGVKVKVTCYDTSLTLLVQSGKMLEDYCSRVLLPYLSSEIKVLGRVIEEKNSQVRDYGEPRKTRQQQKESVKGASTLKPPSTPRVLKAASILELPYTSRPPRLLSYSSPVPKILPLTLLPPGQEEVEVLHPPVRKVLALPPTPRTMPQEGAKEYQELLMVEQDSNNEDTLNDDEKDPVKDAEKDAKKQMASHQDPQKELGPTSKTLPASLDDLPDAELESRFGLLEAIITSQSQTVPDFTINLDSNDVPLTIEENEGDGLNNLSCHKCKNSDKAADALTMHKEATHTNMFEDACQICQKTFFNLASLQDHILSNHGDNSSSVLELLKMHQHLLNSIITGQATQLQKIDSIASNQISLRKDMNDIKQKSCQLQPPPSLPSHLPTPTAEPVVQPARTAAAPAPSYSQAAAGQQQEPGRRQAAPAPPAPQARRRRRNKLLIAGDSLLANHDRGMMREATKDEVQEVQEVKCYASVYSEAPEVKFRRKNFRDVVPAELEDNDFTAVLMQSSSVELTNMKGKGAAPELLKQTAVVAARNMFDVATAAATFPTVERVILAEALPRIDEMREHAKSGNDELIRLWQEAEPALREKITIGKHDYLTKACPCSDAQCQQFPGPRGGLEASRYGTQDTHGRSYDGIHFRGSSGKIANTRSLVEMLASVGLATPVPRTSELEAGLPGQGQVQGQRQRQGQGQGQLQEQGWQQQGRRKGGRAKGQRREQPFQLALRNRFQGNWDRPSPWRRA